MQQWHIACPDDEVFLLRTLALVSWERQSDTGVVDDGSSVIRFPARFVGLAVIGG